MKIKQKLLISFLSIVSFAVCLITFFILKNQIPKTKTNLEANARLMFNDGKALINSFFDGPTTIVKSIVPYVNAHSFNKVDAERDFESIIKTNPNLLCLYWADSVPVSEGGKFFTSDYWIPEDDYDQTIQNWYMQAASESDTVITKPYIDETTGFLVTTVALSLLKNNQPNGVIGIDITLENLNTVVNSIKLSKSGQSFLIDEAGNYLTNNNFNKALTGNFFDDFPAFRYIKEKIVFTKDQVYLNTNIDSLYICSHSTNNHLGWTLITVGPTDEIFSNIREIITSAIIAGLVVTSGAVLVAFVISHLIVNPINLVNMSVKKISLGNANLTQRIKTKGTSAHDELGELVMGFNTFLEKLQKIVRNIKTSKDNLALIKDNLQSSIDETSSTMTQIFSNITSIGNQVETQARSVTETTDGVTKNSNALNDLNRLIETQSTSVTQASASIEELLSNITSVNSIVERMSDSFNALENITNDGIEKNMIVSQKISFIEKQSKALLDANAAINNVAVQTNLLAMNAAIEAAHAGEAGKGFAVVAGEIRKLSENSSTESKKISDELKKISTTISQVVHDAKISTASFEDVNTKLADTNYLVTQIKTAMYEQSAGSQQIIDALKLMNETTLKVKTASYDMSSENKIILSEVNNLLHATDIIEQAMQEMLNAAKEMDNTSAILVDVSNKTLDQIEKIGSEIDAFTV